jgi:hypothetical protein
LPGASRTCHLRAAGWARCELLLALGDALTKAGSAEDAKQTFGVAADLARTARLPEFLARAALG